MLLSSCYTKQSSNGSAFLGVEGNNLSVIARKSDNKEATQYPVTGLKLFFHQYKRNRSNFEVSVQTTIRKNINFSWPNVLQFQLLCVLITELVFEFCFLNLRQKYSQQKNQDCSGFGNNHLGLFMEALPQIA